jgi:hypothetical protein
MKIKHKKVLTFGDVITAAYQVWGADQAEAMVRLAFNMRLLVFRDHPHFLISFAKGRSA